MAVERESPRDWHRLFGLLLTDYFTGAPVTVELERDLSAQQQLLDVLIVRRDRGPFAGRLPDGLAELAPHNLVTFKSHREALDGWAVKELASHSVAYRKLVSPSPSELLPDEHFRLYAVCARFPRQLSGQVPWQQRQAGVYDCQWAIDTVRVIVAGELPPEPHNAPSHLFSASPQLLGFARGAYRPRSEHTSRLLRQLFERFQREGLTMSYTMEDFERDYFLEHFPQLTAQEHRAALERLTAKQRRELLQSLPAQERLEILQSLPAQERREVLQSLPPEERLAGLPPEERLAGLPPEERLAGLSAEQIRAYLDRLTAGQPPAPRKPRRKK